MDRDVAPKSEEAMFTFKKVTSGQVPDGGFPLLEQQVEASKLCPPTMGGNGKREYGQDTRPSNTEKEEA